MKVKLDYKKLTGVEKRLINENDRLIYEIERYKSMDYVVRYAAKHGMKKITPSDIESVLIKKR